VKSLRSPAMANDFESDDGGIRPCLHFRMAASAVRVIDDDLIIMRAITSNWSPSKKK
jgi:hypothetical protein